MTAKRRGPLVTINRSCSGCEFECSESYAVQSDSGFRVYCTHSSVTKKRVGDTTWETPAWCPLLAEESKP